MRTSACLVCAFTIVTVPAVNAADSGKLAVSTMQVHMTEFDNTGQSMVKESGWLPGLEGSLAHTSGNAHLFATGRIYGGHIDYDGRIQSGQGFKSRTATRLAQLRLGGAYGVSTNGVIGAALEEDRWVREIEGSDAVQGLRERTRSLRLTIDGAHSWATSGGEVSVSAGMYRAAAEKLTVTSPETTFDPVSLKTHPATGYRAALGWRPASIRNVELMWSYDSIRISRSEPVSIKRDGIAAGFLQQPEHRRRHVALTIAYYF
jgi:hypothetical protein